MVAHDENDDDDGDDEGGRGLRELRGLWCGLSISLNSSKGECENEISINK